MISKNYLKQIYDLKKELILIEESKELTKAERILIKKIKHNLTDILCENIKVEEKFKSKSKLDILKVYMFFLRVFSNFIDFIANII